MHFFTLLTQLAAAAAVHALTVTPIIAVGSTTAVVVAPAPTTTAPVSAVAAVSAVSISTYVVSSFTTVCATAGTFYYLDVCYTATAASQTVTVTNCPCTLTSTLVAAKTTPAIAYVTAGANNIAAVGGMMGALAVGAAALVL